MASGTHTAARNGEAPPCDHLDTIHTVQPASAGCQQCLARGDGWVELRICLRCGWVACSDESPSQHAKAHYEETDHPINAAFEPASTRRWCYVHQRAV
jgi:uncharacterized UBP type Zn finger protein